MRRLIAIVLLAACAPAPDPAALRALFDAEQVAQLDVPMLLLSTDTIATPLIARAQRNGVQIWQSREGQQVSESAGVVIATRGLGHDLMAADTGGAPRAGTAPYARHWIHLDGRLQLVRRDAPCQLVLQGTQRHQAPLETPLVRVFVETCSGADPITNTYHIGADGVVWWSRQWVSDQVGMITLERIAR